MLGIGIAIGIKIENIFKSSNENDKTIQTETNNTPDPEKNENYENNNENTNNTENQYKTFLINELNNRKRTIQKYNNMLLGEYIVELSEQGDLYTTVNGNKSLVSKNIIKYFAFDNITNGGYSYLFLINEEGNIYYLSINELEKGLKTSSEKYIKEIRLETVEEEYDITHKILLVDINNNVTNLDY